MLVKDSVLKSLIGLLCVFVLGYGSIVAMHIVFKNISDDLDIEIKNETARYQIGEYILQEINAVERNYYQMAMSYTDRAIVPIQNNIKEELQNISEAITVLEEGGTLEKNIKLNIVGVNQAIEKIIFTPNATANYTFEAIDLRPKLGIIEGKLSEMKRIIELKDEIINHKHKDGEDLTNKRFEVQIFFKTIPPMFIRMKENASRLLYDSKRNLEKLENNVVKERKYYDSLEYIITFLVVLFVFIFGSLVIKQIMRKSHELEKLTKLAEMANETKSKFLANMSHEIRTPLNAIIGFSELLLKANLSSEEKERANIIVKSGKSLLYIINDILDLSKVESGKLEIVIEPMNLNETMEQVIELYAVSAEQKQIRFIYNQDKNLPEFIKSDEIRLKQVISNIISNAIKFTPQFGKVQFDLELVHSSQNEAVLRFSISDTGVGIAPKNQKLILEPFSQADSGVSKKFGGTGLGLSISNQILNLLGSKIEITSEENKGSTFYFELTVEKKNTQNNSDQEVSVENKKYNFAVFPTLSDEENLYKNLLGILDDFGNTFDSIEQIEKCSKIDLLFCSSSSYGFIDMIQESKSKFDAPLVYVGNVTEIETNFALKKLIDFYLDTPLYGSKVFNIISEVCNTEENLQKEHIASEDSFSANVLVAEDNMNNQILIRILLEQLGIEVTMASNGKEAHEEFEKNSFDLVFMDINMPIMDGISSLKKIREYEAIHSKTPTPVIALTADAIKGNKEKYLDAGMNNFLAKPIDNNKLLTFLQQYLVKDTPVFVEKKNIKEEPHAEVMDVSSEKNILDEEKIAKKLGINVTVVRMLIEKFQSKIGTDLSELEEYIHSDNKEDIATKAHYVKNSCLNFGMDECCMLLQKLEADKLEKNENIKIVEKLKKLLHY